MEGFVSSLAAPPSAVLTARMRGRRRAGDGGCGPIAVGAVCSARREGMVMCAARDAAFVRDVRGMCERLAEGRGLRVDTVAYEHASKTLDVRIAYNSDGEDGAGVSEERGGPPQSVSVETLEDFSRDLGELLDDADIVPTSVGAYALEVSTPGIKNELSANWQFETYKGFAVEVKASEPYKNKTEWRGSLSRRTPDAVVLSQKGRVVKIPRSIIQSVALVTATDEDGDDDDRDAA